MQEELIKEFKNGNRQAGDDFYNANKGLVCLAVKMYKPKAMDFEETLAIVNQAFAFSMKKYDDSKGKFTSYFMKSAHGHISRHLRDFNSTLRTKRVDFTKTKTSIFCDSLDRVIYESESIDICIKDTLGFKDDFSQVMVMEALNKLNTKDRHVFKLQLFNGLSQIQIAKIIGTNQTAISRRIARAKASLKIILKEVC